MTKTSNETTHMRMALIFGLVGLAQGLVLTMLGDWLGEPESPAALFAYCMVVIAPAYFYYQYQPDKPNRSLLQDALISMAVPAALTGLMIGAQYRHDGYAGFSAWFVFPYLIAGCVALLYTRALTRAKDWQDRYEQVFDGVWIILLTAALSFVFVGAVLSLVVGLAALFAIVGVDLLGTVISNNYAALAFMGGAYGVAIGALLTRQKIVNASHAIGATLLRIPAPVLAFFIILFVLLLPFTGLQPLWDTSQATPLVLSMVIVAGLLTNSVVDNGGTTNRATPASWLIRLLQAQSVGLLVLVAIATYSTWLRIDQHGLVPERFAGLLLVAAAALFCGGYVIALLRPTKWETGVRRWNYFALPVVAIVAIACLTPVLDPYRLSVNSQLTRLEVGRVAPEDFDLGFLKYKAGRAGQAALAKIEANQAVEVYAALTPNLAALSTTKSYHGWRQIVDGTIDEPLTFDLAKWRDAFVVRPAGVELPDHFFQELHRWNNKLFNKCVQDKSQSCALIAGQIVPGGEDEVVLVLPTTNNSRVGIYFLQEIETNAHKLWDIFHKETHFKHDADGAAALWAAIEQDRISIVPASFQMLQIGEVALVPSTKILFRGQLTPAMAPLAEEGEAATSP